VKKVQNTRQKGEQIDQVANLDETYPEHYLSVDSGDAGNKLYQSWIEVSQRIVSLQTWPFINPAVPLPDWNWVFVLRPLGRRLSYARAQVARGGLRWSDRMKLRTEVLGFSKAQMVKYAVFPFLEQGGFRRETIEKEVRLWEVSWGNSLVTRLFVGC